MKANFKNTTTGKLFHVTTHSTRYCEEKKKHINTDVLGNEIVDPETGEVLEDIPFDDRTDDLYTSIITKASPPQELGKDARQKNINYLKERSRKHTRSDSGKSERMRSINREIDSINRSGRTQIKK